MELYDNIKDRQRIGRRITEIRQSKGMSVDELAEAAGVRPSNLMRIEQGKYSAHIDYLGKIAAALNCEIIIIEII